MPRASSKPLAVGRRIIGPIATVIAASFLVAMALALSPGDPVAKLAGPKANEEKVERVREELGLDQPPLQRYVNWLGSAVQGDFGASIPRKTSVSSLLGPRIGITLFLVVYAALLIAIFGIGLGILGGAFRSLGPVVAAICGLAIAVPTFVAAVLLVNWFSLDLGLLPATGPGEGFWDRLEHLTLPAIALALSWAAFVGQVTRAAVQEERSREHVEAALARGLHPAGVFRRHVLRNAAVPIATVSGLTVAGLVASSVVVEEAFGLGGVGSLLVESVANKDFNVVQAITMFLVVLFVVITSAIDMLQTALDPRLRGQEGEAR